MSGRTALVSLRLHDGQQARIEAGLRERGFEILHPGSPAEWELALSRAEIAWLSGAADVRLLGRPLLRWIHYGMAGADRFLPAGMFANGAAITTASGRASPALAEHAIYLMMALAYDQAGLDRYARWRRFAASSPQRRRALHGRTLGLIGLGSIGSLVAAYANALGMRVLGYRRQARPLPAGVERQWCSERGERVDEMLAACEFLVIACGLNSASRGLVGATQLAALPRGAFLVNISRGAVVDEAALLAALRSGHLGGAGFDVFEREPLPTTHPFWRMPQVRISPHQPPRLDLRERRHADALLANLERFLAGEPLLAALTLADAIEPTPARGRGLPERLHGIGWRFCARIFGVR